MKIKVGFIVLGLDFSGAENVLCDYINESNVIDPQIILIYKGNVKKEFEKRVNKKVNILCLNESYKKNELRFFPYLCEKSVFKKLKYLIKKQKIDIVYANNTLELMLCKIAAKKISVPFVGHIHDMKENFGTIFKVLEVKRAFHYYDRLITVSKACKSSWNFSKIKVIYNGIEPSFISTNINPTRSIKMVGFVGMLNRRKGADLLYKVIQHDASHLRWMIAYNTGSSKLIQKYNLLSSNNKNIKIYHHLGKEEICNFYENIDLLVVPSRQDPLPTVVLEAMGKGKLVIGADNAGGILELLGDKELMFKCTTNSLENKINEIQNWSEKHLQRDQIFLHNRSLSIFNSKVKTTMINEILTDLK